MATSMTGYGRGRRGGCQVELRSVNHRHLDVRVSLPASLDDCTPEVEAFIRRHFERGRIEARVRVEPTAEGVAFDAERARRFVDEARRLAEALGLSDEVSLRDVLAAPGVAERGRSAEDTLREELMAALEVAIGECVRMRRAEGEALVGLLVGHVASAEGWAARMRKRADIAIRERRDRLVSRMEELLGATEAERARIGPEVALLLDRLDFTEELDRLGAHFGRFRQLLEGGGAMGRKLDFLVQEMNREANTAGAKASDVEIAHAVVELKAELERLREQAQNIE